MSHDHDKKKKSAEEKRAEKENAKRLLLDTNLERVFNILAGYAHKRSMGESLENLHIRLKQLRSQIGSERGSVFGHVGPEQTQEEIIGEVAKLEQRQSRTKHELAHLQKTVMAITRQDIAVMFDKLGFEGHHDRPGCVERLLFLLLLYVLMIFFSLSLFLFFSFSLFLFFSTGTTWRWRSTG